MPLVIQFSLLSFKYLTSFYFKHFFTSSICYGWTVWENISRNNVDKHAIPPWQRRRSRWSQSGESRCAQGGPWGATLPRFMPCTLHQTQGFLSFYSFVFHFTQFFDNPPLTHSTQWLYCQKPIFRPTLLKSHLKRKIHQKSKNYIFNRFHTKSAVSFKCGKSRVEFQVKLAFAVSHLIITQKPGVSLSRWKTHCMGQLLHKQGKGCRRRPIRLNF